MRAVVYQHEEDEGLGQLRRPLESAGFSLIQRFRTARHEDVTAELVVVLGGAMGVYQTAEHPFLDHERAVLAERLALGRPCLGICLGAQLLASAAGAEVFPGKNGLELGVAPLRWTKEALADPVITGVRAKTAAAHWHQDTYASVPGATLLASTDRYVQQGFRLGDSYAFQFHLELTATELKRWLESARPELEAAGKAVDALIDGATKLDGSRSEHEALMERLAHHFASKARA